MSSISSRFAKLGATLCATLHLKSDFNATLCATFHLKSDFNAKHSTYNRCNFVVKLCLDILYSSFTIHFVKVCILHYWALNTNTKNRLLSKPFNWASCVITCPPPPPPPPWLPVQWSRTTTSNIFKTRGSRLQVVENSSWFAAKWKRTKQKSSLEFSIPNKNSSGRESFYQVKITWLVPWYWFYTSQ